MTSNYTVSQKKGASFIFAITLTKSTDFNNSCTVVFADLLLRKMVLKRPRKLKFVAALPCET